jgi:catechol 2,3-dioxygenase-like lactoylglutathione lyase family enzyme
MLAASRIIAFAATADSERSRAFYERVLGIRFISEDEFAVVYDVQGVELRIQKVSAFAPQPHTQLGWSVSSIVEVVQTLEERGAVFERYSFLEQDSHGIWTAPSGARIAWLKDPDGNVLSVTEQFVQR